MHHHLNQKVKINGDILQYIVNKPKKARPPLILYEDGLAGARGTILTSNGKFQVRKGCLYSLNNNVDTLILGCTHYPLLKDVIFNNTENINLIDSASSVAEATYNELLTHKLLSNKQTHGVLKCYVTDLPMRFEELGNIFFGSDITDVHLVNEF